MGHEYSDYMVGSHGKENGPESRGEGSLQQPV